MSKKLIHKLIMYHEIHKRHRDGLKSSQISRLLGLTRRTVRKYLAMSVEEFLEFVHSQKERDKMLEHYKLIKIWLENCPNASAVQFHDWMGKHFIDFIDITENPYLPILYIYN